MYGTLFSYYIAFSALSIVHIELFSMIYYVRIFNYLLMLIYIYMIYTIFFSVIRILNNVASSSETFITLCAFFLYLNIYIYIYNNQ